LLPKETVNGGFAVTPLTSILLEKLLVSHLV
jgi:hypothetical protein